MRPHDINIYNQNFIGGWFINEDLCDLLINDFENRKPVQKESHSSRGYKVIDNRMMSTPLMDAYQDYVKGALAQYKLLYPFCTETIEAFYMSEPYNIQKYEKGKHYSAWHCENNGDPRYRYRHLAFMTYLNTVDEGGETEFLHQNVKIKPEKGLTLIWPAHFTHIHRGLPSHTTEKYVTTGWFDFFDTENFLNKQKDVSDKEFWDNLDNLDRNVS